MPNWCYNQISISHDDKAPFDWLVNILQHGHSGIFNAIVPLPGGEWDCDLAVSQWGTKWDILPEESPAAKRCPEAEICDLQFASDECGNWVHFTCETAWGPPYGVLKSLHERGFSVSCHYEEPNMDFAGEWCDGHDARWSLEDGLPQEASDDAATEAMMKTMLGLF